MTEQEQRDVYNTLDTMPVTIKSEKHYMQTCEYRTETEYSFGDYIINHTEYTPATNSRPQFSIRNRNKKILEHWNDSFCDKNKYIYDMYIAAKNKSADKPYINPFKTNNMDAFSQILNENSKHIFPKDMPTDRCVEAMNELKQVLHKHIARYNTK